MKAIRFTILILICLIAFCSFHSVAQVVRGQVVDSVTREPLAFVNIVYNNNKQGVATNIDGGFLIPAGTQIDFLSISYIGYKSKKFSIDEIKNQGFIRIELASLTMQLSEVSVLPGINPAHRIIRKVVENRDLNNPEKITSFSYDSYTKLIFTFDLDSNEISKKDTIREVKDSVKVDSAYLELSEFVDQQHFFISESVTHRDFIYPDKNKETVLASRSSGFKSPFFTFISTQFQSFSFYNEFFTISDKMYLNPVSRGSIDKYFFLIEDTLFNERKDTVFVISFRPRKGKNFDGLKGFLHINSNGYAIENVKAVPNDEIKELAISIQQKYELIDGKHWFPVQLNTFMNFKSLEFKLPTGNFSMVGIGKTYLSNIVIAPELNKRDFSNVEFVADESAYQRDSVFWAQHRLDSLSSKDIKTYHVIDSIGEKMNLDGKMKTMESLIFGNIPVGIFNVNYAQVIGYSRFEGFKMGMGLMTNEKVSRWFSVGGNIMYGFKDKKIKYGGRTDLILSKKHETTFSVGYTNDVSEIGGYSFFEDRIALSTDSYRRFYIERMVGAERYTASFRFRTIRYLRVNVFASKITNSISDLYVFTDSSFIVPENGNTYNFVETGVQLKYIYKEKFMVLPRGKYSMGSDYPVVYFNLATEPELGYFKYEMKITKGFRTKNLGKTDMQVVAGMTTRDIPYINLYNGYGSFSGKFPVDVPNSFCTMRMDEFLSQRFIYFFFIHDFGPLLFKSKWFKPQIAVVQNMGIGDMYLGNHHSGIDFKTMEKGYHESGVQVNNILKINYFGYGVGIYYRYGAYGFIAPKNNFGYRITLRYVI